MLQFFLFLSADLCYLVESHTFLSLRKFIQRITVNIDSIVNAKIFIFSKYVKNKSLFVKVVYDEADVGITYMSYNAQRSNLKKKLKIFLGASERQHF